MFVREKKRDFFSNFSDGFRVEKGEREAGEGAKREERESQIEIGQREEGQARSPSPAPSH